jgi:hypothetical protein
VCGVLPGEGVRPGAVRYGSNIELPSTTIWGRKGFLYFISDQEEGLCSVGAVVLQGLGLACTTSKEINDGRLAGGGGGGGGAGGGARPRGRGLRAGGTAGRGEAHAPTLEPPDPPPPPHNAPPPQPPQPSHATRFSPDQPHPPPPHLKKNAPLPLDVQNSSY